MTELLIYLFFAVAAIVPLTKLLPQYGIHKYWAFTAVLPVFVIILLWVMALKLQEKEGS